MLVQFIIHGCNLPVKEHFYQTLKNFEEAGLSLKSVSYDYDHNRVERSSINKFLSAINEKEDDKLCTFTVFQGKRIREPATWEYGVYYFKNHGIIKIFFNTPLFDKKISMKEIIYFLVSKYLSDQVASFGYLYTGSDETYSLGGFVLHSPALYKEDTLGWDTIFRPFNRHIVLNLSGLLRHVYTVNLIDRKLLDYSASGFNFREWLSTGEFGTTEKVGKENWLWKVPEDKLYEAGKILYAQDLLIGVEGYKEILARHGMRVYEDYKEYEADTGIQLYPVIK